MSIEANKPDTYRLTPIDHFRSFAVGKRVWNNAVVKTVTEAKAGGKFRHMVELGFSDGTVALYYFHEEIPFVIEMKK